MFSVVIPLYNKQLSIINTIERVLKQTFQEFEVLVIDDGSTDKSAELVKNITDKRVKLVQKKNEGVCSARNEGIKHAQYDYIAFLDADDLWDSDYLNEQKKLIHNFPHAAMWGINFAPVENGKITTTYYTALPEGYRGFVENYFSMKGRVSDLFCSSSVVVKKNAFETAGLFDTRIKYSEDLDMWYRIILNFPVVFYDKIMVFYQHDSENRALLRVLNLKYSLPYYIDKYNIYKAQKDFYYFIHRWSAIHIREYYFKIKEEREAAKRAILNLDYSVLPSKYKYMFKTPYFIGKLVYVITSAKQKMLKK